MQLRQYFVEILILQGFQAAKNRFFRSFLTYFLHILEILSKSNITKKLGNPYIPCVLEPYYFSL